MAVQNTIQPTITSDDAKVDSGISGFAPGPPPPPAPAERRRETARLDVGHGHADDAPLDVEQVRDDVAAEDRRQDQLQHDEEDHRDRPLSHQRGQPEADDEPDGRLERDPQPDVDHQRGRGDQEVGAVVGVVLVGDRDRERPDLGRRFAGGDGDRPPPFVWMTVTGRGTAGLTVAARHVRRRAVQPRAPVEVEIADDLVGVRRRPAVQGRTRQPRRAR